MAFIRKHKAWKGCNGSGAGILVPSVVNCRRLRNSSSETFRSCPQTARNPQIFSCLILGPQEAASTVAGLRPGEGVSLLFAPRRRLPKVRFAFFFPNRFICMLLEVACTIGTYPGGKPGAILESISHRRPPILAAFVRELTKESTDLPLGCLQGGCLIPRAPMSAPARFPRDPPCQVGGVEVSDQVAFMDQVSCSWTKFLVRGEF